FVVPGANDIANPEAASFDGATATKVESISKEAFATLYAPYGYESAETRDANTLSYMAYVNDKIAVIALDGCEFSADGDSLIISGSLTQETITWMESACATAQATGRKVVAIASHLVTIPYNGYATLGTMMNNNDAIDLIGSILGGGTDGTSAPKYEIDNATIKEKIAHCGITAVFTAGHNSTDIQTVVAEDPTYQFVQVNSGFATAYECPLRTVAFTESGINISTEFLKDLPNFVGTPFEDLAYQSTFTGFPKMVEKVVAERWESIDAFLKKNFIFEVDTTGTALISDMNIFFKLPQTPEEMAEIINTSIVPPLLKVVTTLAQGNEDKRDSEGLLAEFHNGVDGIFLGLLQPDYRTNTIIAPLILSSIKDGFAGAGLDVDALVDGIVGSIVYNFVGSDPTQVTNDLYLTAPYGTFDETLGIKDIENTQISNSNSQMYNLQGIRVADNYRGIVIKNNKKYIAK
ncbi:MAG: hypothetical protein Q4F34_09125, partial [Prevotellaceae bacterium]|nr:hypothetical protein [Prevotellaceae bacterium]